MENNHSPIGNYRWTICALLFFATTINYIDRQVIGLLKPTLEQEFHWTETDYARIVMAFSAAYALGLFLFGRIVDRIGTRVGYFISVSLWSMAAVLHSVVSSTTGFVGVRAFLGVSEGGNFPNAIRAAAEWFPKKERAFATGIFNSGANIGAMVAPVLVPWILGAYGWRMAFLYTGALGFIWLVFWITYYEIPSRQKRLSKAEYAFIHQEESVEADVKGSVSIMTILKIRQTWAFIFGKFLTDPIWWFFLFWLPSYFSEAYDIDLKRPNLHLFVVYMATTLGSIGGGYLSTYLIGTGWTVFRARKISMLIFACAVVPVMTAPFATNVWVAVTLISLAAAAHQAWSATIFTTASDMFPRRVLSSVVGIGGMAGSIGGILFPLLVGTVLDYYKAAGDITVGYNILFVISGSSYLVAWLVMHLLTPKMETVIING